MRAGHDEIKRGKLPVTAGVLRFKRARYEPKRRPQPYARNLRCFNFLPPAANNDGRTARTARELPPRAPMLAAAANSSPAYKT